MIIVKKIDIRKLCIYILILFLFIYLKNGIISFEEYNQGIYNVIIFWGEDIFNNIIWLLPIIFTFYVLSKKYFYNLLEFNMRYQNRRRYLKKIFLNFFTDSILFNSFIYIFQIIILLYINKQSFILNSFVLTFLFQYIIEMTLASLIIILVGLLFKTFIYAYIVYIASFLLGLMLLNPNQYLPFISLYSGVNINVISLIVIIISVVIIKKMYKHYDIGGIEL